MGCEISTRSCNPLLKYLCNPYTISVPIKSLLNTFRIPMITSYNTFFYYTVHIFVYITQPQPESFICSSCKPSISTAGPFRYFRSPFDPLDLRDMQLRQEVGRWGGFPVCGGGEEGEGFPGFVAEGFGCFFSQSNRK